MSLLLSFTSNLHRITPCSKNIMSFRTVVTDNCLCLGLTKCGICQPETVVILLSTFMISMSKLVDLKPFDNLSVESNVARNKGFSINSVVKE